MTYPWVPGPVVEVAGVEYYEIVGYGIDGRLLLEKAMIDKLSEDDGDALIDRMIDKQLERQDLIKSRRR